MRCPFCGSLETQVKDSRAAEDGNAIRRRRICSQCAGRFTTYERVQLRDIMVIKRSGRRSPFDREKLQRSIEIALRKRPITQDRMDILVSGLVRQIESRGDNEISSEAIGEYVMSALKELDDVAYVRFASVYKNFGEASDFNTIIEELAKTGHTLAHDEG
jgi:transcriptional repressor NrdR